MQAGEEGSPFRVLSRVLDNLRALGWLVGCCCKCIWDRRGRVFAMLNFSLRFIGKVAACVVPVQQVSVRLTVVHQRLLQHYMVPMCTVGQ